MKTKNGKCAVPSEICEQWRKGGEGRAALENEFARCGFKKAQVSSKVSGGWCILCVLSCMYTCMHIYIYTYTCMHIYICLHMHIYIYGYICI